MRARDIITERCPNTTIHLRHDKHGNPELHRTAQSADYFLVVTRSATHSATGVIEQHVPTDRLIRPHGKGTSSMIRDLVQYARKRIS